MFIWYIHPVYCWIRFFDRQGLHFENTFISTVRNTIASNIWKTNELMCPRILCLPFLWIRRQQREFTCIPAKMPLEEVDTVGTGVRRILTACVKSVTARCCSDLGFDAIFHANEATLLHSFHLKLLLIIINTLATLVFIPLHIILLFFTHYVVLTHNVLDVHTLLFVYLMYT